MRPSDAKIGDSVEDGVVLAAIVRTMVALDVNRLRTIFEHNFAFGILRRLEGRSFVGLRTRGQTAEVFLEDGHGLGGRHSTGDRDNHVGGHVVRVKEFLSLGGGEGVEVGYPSYRGPMVRMGGKCLFGELLKQAAERIAVGPHAAFFDDYIALFIKLAQHGMQEAFGFEVSPQLETIHGKRVVIFGLVVTGGGVHVLATVLFNELAEGVADDVFVGLRDGVFPGLFELLQLCVIAANRLVALCEVGGVGNLDLLQGRLFGGVIGGADFVGALECHVLEHMRQAGGPQGILRGTSIHQSKKGENRGFGTLADHEREAIGQLFDSDALFEGRDVLPQSNGGEQKQDKHSFSSMAFHRTSDGWNSIFFHGLLLDGAAGWKFESTWPGGKLSNRRPVASGIYRWTRTTLYFACRRISGTIAAGDHVTDSTVEIQGKHLKLSNLEKVLYPATGFAKQQVIDYYARIAPAIIPHLAGRALTRKRYPDGVNGEPFLRRTPRNIDQEWVKTAFPSGARATGA